MKGECKSIVNAIKAFLQGDMPCALCRFHKANEDQMCMFGDTHFHAVAYTGHDAIKPDLSHCEVTTISGVCGGAWGGLAPPNVGAPAL